ncbi:MAG: antibiotic biosynthesis monooxygenase [Chloroflexi bacterium]|nr:antibiotic biosynthesis monooxygenase [Chloroflexota bacterium]
MLTVLVSIKIKSEHVKAFIAATIEETRTSLQDAGVVQFDILQESDDAAHFTLHEVYASREIGLQHLEMAHFKKWQSTIKPMLIEPPHAAAYEHVVAKE